MLYIPNVVKNGNVVWVWVEFLEGMANGYAGEWGVSLVELGKDARLLVFGSPADAEERLMGYKFSCAWGRVRGEWDGKRCV